ncbi:carbon monoxide dehydrogenase subunit G [Nonomuraea sp. NPDC049421]|uniref:SRPBCC family protein n=1 Tax=Nonomuraea sp. NPDC049421 TaxID=3155275 RepID=UPI003415E49C
MNVAGSVVIEVDRDRLWAAFRDPAVLVRTIPGCERLEECGPDTYRMTVNAGVASVKGVYQGEVALSDPLPPERFTLKARGQGAPGTVDATVQVRLSEADGGTRVDYDAEAVIGGMIGGVGQRMLGSVAKRTAQEFFSAVEQHLCAPVPAVAPARDAAPLTDAGALTDARSLTDAAPAAVYERPRAPRTETRPWVMLAAFGTGAGVALAGVTLGWLLGRGTRRRA